MAFTVVGETVSQPHSLASLSCFLVRTLATSMVLMMHPPRTLQHAGAQTAAQQPMLPISSSAAPSAPSILASLSTPAAPALQTFTTATAPSLTPSASASRHNDPPTLLSSSVPGPETSVPVGSQPLDQYRGPKMMTPPITPRESIVELDKSQPLPPGWTEHVSKTTGQ